MKSINIKATWITVFITAAILFVVSSFLQVPRDPLFACTTSGNKGNTTRRPEYGLPLAFLKRAVPPAQCFVKNDLQSSNLNKDGTLKIDHFKDEFGKSRIYPLSLVADVLIWSAIAYGVIKLTSDH